jgi:phosphoribosylformylglycinamidine cyclo-ligase
LTKNNKNQGKSFTYKDAGVDIDAGERLVDAIKPMAKSTKRAGANADLGGFGGLFDLKAAGYNDPIIVAATDGVGTKLKLAIETGNLSTVGIDLVAMCVNDLIVQGAEPLLFLDYFATGELKVDEASKIISGIAEGCRQAGCVLIGGETAEMPDMYKKGDFDLAGFSVGAAERGSLIDGKSISAGDIIIGLPSSGVHSNGFSLVRKLLEVNDISLSDNSTIYKGKTVGEVFLTPTNIYVKQLLPLIKAGLVKGLAHITGGGLLDNIPRILPKNTSAILNADNIKLLPEFIWLAELGNLSPFELSRTFNCGIGMTIIVDKNKSELVINELEKFKTYAQKIGVVNEGDGKPITQINGSAGTWGFSEAFSFETTPIS